jgi:hypothetical protein
MARYRVLSDRFVLAPLGDEVELADQILAARLVRGGHLAIADGNGAQVPPSNRRRREEAAASAASKSSSSVSSEDTDTLEESK